MLERIPRRLAALLSLLMVLAGFALIVWLLARLPITGRASNEGSGLPVDEPQVQLAATVTPAAVVALAGDAPLSLASPTPAPPVVIGLADGLPVGLVQAVTGLAESDPYLLLASADAPTATLRLDWQPGGEVVYGEVYALAARFDTLFAQAEGSLILELWRDGVAEGAVYNRMVVLSDTLPALISLLGETGSAVQAVTSVDELLDAAWADDGVLVLLPFEQLTPELVVFAVDGQNPVDNRFDADAYPLVATVYAHLSDSESEWTFLDQLAAVSRGTNRDPERLTVLAMTGVTALVRQTAWQMDQFGPEWVAEVVGPELAAADITAISNEVPFVPGCVTNTSVENLTFCSSPDYMAALEAVGADIIGLTGNHQNDYGREATLTSLDIYAAAGLPVYGGGRTKEEAFAPLYIEHNGNRLAFLGANSYGPDFAWATDDGPGSAEFDLNILSATIRAVKEQDKTDVVLVELQYQESYGVDPLWDQRQNFRLLSQTGADIVTGVQSHVPQAIEFEDGRLILYGLGNLFFDQMWRQDTREGLIVKHSFYAGRHIGTQILTTLLYDYGQPRWTSDAERESLLRRVFDASYWPRLSQP
ncbi:MAG: CapA family protein [Chloroflexi bacterium]|nr:CapA family protein [Chloroflexota bacterium]